MNGAWLLGVVLVDRQKARQNELAGIFAIILVFSILSPAVSASNASTSSYSVGSFHTGLTGENGSSLSFGFRSTLTFQQPVSDYSNTTNYLFTTGFLSGTGTDREPEEEEPAGNGYQPPGPGGGTTPGTGPAGGIPGCTEDWTCTEWEPSECPESGIQTRVCTDSNSCGTSVDRPAESRSCTPGTETETVMDIRVPDSIRQGEGLPVLVSLDIEKEQEAQITYVIKDLSGNVVYEDTESRTVEPGVSVSRSLDTGLEPGSYRLSVIASYGNRQLSGAVSFDVLTFTPSISPGEIMVNLGWLTPVVIVAILVSVLAYRKFSMRKPESKLRRLSHLMNRIDHSTKRQDELIRKIRERVPSIRKGDERKNE